MTWRAVSGMPYRALAHVHDRADGRDAGGKLEGLRAGHVLDPRAKHPLAQGRPRGPGRWCSPHRWMPFDERNEDVCQGNRGSGDEYRFLLQGSQLPVIGGQSRYRRSGVRIGGSGAHFRGSVPNVEGAGPHYNRTLDDVASNICEALPASRARRAR